MSDADDADADDNSHRRLRGENSSPLHSEAYVDRFETCFACNILLSSSVVNKNLYDDSSLTAMLSAIHLIMNEPEDSITYDRDPSKLCPYTGKHCNFVFIFFC
jgi:hypothetical protein